ncbi:hypothetical protein U1Q18_037770, partial [Sarracenia purpurea var. burkii]
TPSKTTNIIDEAISVRSKLREWLKTGSFEKESVPLVCAELISLNMEHMDFCHGPLFKSARMASLEARIHKMKMINPVKVDSKTLGKIVSTHEMDLDLPKSVSPMVIKGTTPSLTMVLSSVSEAKYVVGFERVMETDSKDENVASKGKVSEEDESADEDEVSKDEDFSDEYEGTTWEEDSNREDREFEHQNDFEDMNFAKTEVRAEVPVSDSTSHKVSSDMKPNVDTKQFFAENCSMDGDFLRMAGSANMGK